MKHSKLVIAFGAITVLGVLNFTQSERGFAMSQALASGSGGSSSSSSNSELKWSKDISCPGFFNGNYRVCEYDNGEGNPCSTPGHTTCTCGENC